MTIAIIYTRFSPRPNAAECDSDQKQGERCLAYCAKNGLNLQATYGDEGVSGGVYNRPGLREALDSLSPGEVLVVDSADRLARDMLVSLTIRHEVEKAGATIEYANGSTCENTPEGKLFENILAAFSAYERDRIRLRTKNGLAKKKAAGVHLGKVPIGYRVDPETKGLVEDGFEQVGMRRAAQMWLEHGSSADHIANELTRYYGPLRGKPWSGRSIRRILAKKKKKKS